MAVVGTLELRILAGIAELQANMNSAVGIVTRSTQQMESALSTAKAGFQALGIAAGVVSFAAMVKSTIDALDHLNDLSKSTGIVAETLAGLQYAAKQTGGDLDGLAGSINKLSQNMGKDAEKFKALGISAKDPLEAFKQLADLYVALEDPAQRAAVMAAALGKSWQSAAPLLAEGGKRIGEMVAEGTKLSGITQQMVEDADRFNDQLVTLNTTLDATKIKMVGDLLEPLIAVAKAMTQGAEEGGKLMAVIRGIQTLLTGDDLHKSNVALTEATSRLLDLENQLLEVRAREVIGLTPAMQKMLEQGRAAEVRQIQAQIAETKQVIETTRSYRAELEALKTVQTGPSATDAEKRAAAARASRFLDDGKAAKAWAAEQERLRKLDAKGWVEYIEALEKADEFALKENEKNWDAHWKLMEQLRVGDLKGALDAIEKMAEANDELLRSQASLAPSMTQLYADAKKSLDQLLASAEQEISLFGLSNTERARAIALAERDLELKKLEVAIHPDLIDKTNALYAARMKLIDAAEARAKADQFTNTVTDALLNGFEAAKGGIHAFLDWLKSEFLRTELRPLIKLGVTSLLGAAGLGSSAASASELGPILGSLGKLFSGGNSGFGMTDRSLGGTTFPELFEKFLGDNAPILKGLGQVAGGIAIGLGAGGALAKAIGGDDVRPLHSIIGTVVGGIIGAFWGYAGAAIGSAVGGTVGGLLDGILNEGLAQRTASVGAGGNQTYGTSGRFGSYGIQRGTDEHFSDADMSQTLNNWFRAIGKLDTEVAKHFSTAEIDRASAVLGAQNPLRLDFGQEHSALDPEVFATMIRQRYGAMFSAIDQQMADLITNFKGSGEDLLTLIVDLATVHDRLSGLHDSLSTLFGQEVGFADIAKLKGDTEGYTEALQRLAAEYGVTNQIADMLGKTQQEVWGSIGLASEGARARLIELAGGIEKLGSSLQFYYEKFYTTQEQQAATLRNLQQAFSDVGVAMPMTLDGFRAITDRFLGMGEAGAQAAATMLGLAPAFYAYIQAIEAVDAAITASGDGLAKIFGEAITLDDVRGFQANGEVLTATLARITSEFAATNQLLGLFGISSEAAFGAFGLASEAARAKLIELSGGLDAFTANLAGFYQNYFSDAERQQMSLISMSDQFRTWGLTMPTTTQGFRDLVQQQLALGPAGATVVAGLLAMQQAFYDTHQAIVDTTSVLGGLTGGALMGASMGSMSGASNADLNAALAKRAATIQEWQDKLDVLEGRRTQQQIDREHALSGVTDETTRAIMQQVYAAEDMIDAMKRAAADTADFAAAMDKLSGTNAYSQANAQTLAATTMAAVTAALPYISGLDVLRTLTQDDFNAYSEANRKLILEALNAAAALNTMTDAAVNSTNAGGQPPNTMWHDLGGGFGYWEAISASLDDNGAAAKLLTDRLSMLAHYYELTGDKVGAMNVLEQQHNIALAALDPTLRELQKQIWVLEDAAAAAAKAAEIDAKRQDMNVQLLRAQGKEQEALQLERMLALAALPIELRYLQNEIYKALDAAALKAKTDAFTKTLDDWVRSIKLDSNLSPLTGTQQLTEAQRQYDLLKAQGMNVDPAALTAAANTLLAAQKAVTGFGGGYSALWATLIKDMETLAHPATPPPPTQGDNLIVGELQATREELRAMREEYGRLMERLIDETRDGHDKVATTVDGGADKLSRATETAATMNERH